MALAGTSWNPQINVHDINIILKASEHQSIPIIMSLYLKTPQNKFFLTGQGLSFGLSYAYYFPF